MSEEDYEKLDGRQRRKMMLDWECAKRQFSMDAKIEQWHIDVPGYQGVAPPVSPVMSQLSALTSPSLLDCRSDPGSIILYP